jgi:energy-coupling factor transporter ATP-binding protein EcfA2
MYLQKVIIHNIRSITDLEMEFPNPAGWHVLIGDNGSGKSSVIRAIAATLIGPQQIMAILPVWSEWLRQNEKKGFIELKILQDKTFDQSKSKRKSPANISNKFILQRENGKVQFESNLNDAVQSPHHYNWGNTTGWFSVAYGAFRRFTVFPKGVETEPVIQIKLPGVVLIDEIDVHLHPTWQTKIGKWFTQVFPNIQFIVATHSPFVCRACQNGSIWRLATPNTKMLAGMIQGIERDRLIYGNILDAYGTELFGDDVSIDEETAANRNRLGELYEKSIMGLIEPSEKAEYNRLKTVYSNFNFKMQFS